ncbi:MAG: FAD-binding oxidoreductase [Planctomycetota bacterium]|nr:MAG: FAD-binding oxidoreductase [Planctomycetota bacterium]
MSFKPLQSNSDAYPSRQSRRKALKVGIFSGMASLQIGSVSAALEKPPGPLPPSKTPKDKPVPFPFHGLLENQGKSYSNWGLTNFTKPAVYVEPISYEDVQAIVKDTKRFPTPVNPVGSLFSVSPTIINNGGTLLCTKKLDEILGLEYDSKGRRIVRVQAGCRLKKLNLWLQSRDLEISFQAEIGEATVGSIAVGDTKDSSLDGAGFFSAGVTGLSYVNSDGKICYISDAGDAASFHEFKCSFGLLGIVLECQIEVRPASLCTSKFSEVKFNSPENLAEAIIRLHKECDAFFGNIILDKLFATCDQRYKAGPGSITPASSQPHFNELRMAKRSYIQQGGLPRPDTNNLRPLIKEITYSRADMVNEYWRPTATENRLDFQFYEHDLANMIPVISQSYAFTMAFEEKYSFVPNAWALYLVNRPESKKKPYGLYSGGPGVSFSFDPIFSTPTDPKWQLFAKNYNSLAIKTLNGKPSPIQTQWLKPGDLIIPKKLAHPRFTTNYYSQFLG